MQLDWEVRSFEQLSNSQLYDILRLRQLVFVVEQQSIYLDLDGKDLQANHMLGTQNGALSAYQRCIPPGISYNESSLGRIVVDPALRGRELGRALVQRGIAYNIERWPGSGICISAQAYLLDFYTSLGFTAEGEEYPEDGIPHRKMRFAGSEGLDFK